ncbi:hypothetical protein A9264_13805 [Vibrio sp. UCD-FRSSP16_10]|uniref:DUF6279 family lipoprotein n=1 Tax=unclassified Vibrio TaxID=2614977 RepID=UPI0007FBD70A|nr:MULTISPECIES: DUF6279 family lipoprotein [unclassified Vibrio]OBT13708.1 hypothetical protein A9260_14185 [Vibrio sp. UCD-FRSSP16_30]OBT20033.1 hypothetical protein A9264_13805 [Vibrio sp. UCD-FRSSP16_10]
MLESKIGLIRRANLFKGVLVKGILVKGVLVGGLLLALTACTAKLMYKNIDWVILEYVDDYVTLNSEQEEILEFQLQQLATWHRSQELPHYQAQLQSLYDTDLSTVDMAFLDAQQLTFRGHISRFTQKATSDVYLVSRSMNQAQIDEFVGNLTRQHEELTKKYSQRTEAQVRAQYVERIEKILRRWLGTISIEQKSIVEQWVNNIQRNDQLWALYRITTRDRIKTLFVRRDNPFFYQQELTALVNHPENGYPTELTNRLKINRELANQSIVKLLATISDEQKQHFREEVKEWLDLVKELQID